MSAAPALLDEPLDLDLEAASYSFEVGAAERIAQLPFRFTGEGIRSPYDRAVTLYLNNPAAATIDGFPRSEIIAEMMREAGIALEPQERGEIASWPLLANDARGLRAIALVQRRELIRRSVDLAHAQGRDPDDRGLLDEHRHVVAELEAIRAFLDDPSGTRSEAPTSPFERWRRSLIRGGEVDPLKSPRYVIHGMASGGSVGQLVGPPSVLKTPLMQEIEATVATGKDFLGKTTKPGRSLHIFAEGSGGAPARLAALYQRHPELEPGDIVALTVPVMFGKEGEAEAFAQFVVETLVTGHEKPLRLIVIDTQSQSMEGSTNDDELFAALERGIRHVIRSVELAQGEPAFGVLIHHPGHNNQTRGRGSSAQGGNLDFIWVVEPRTSDFKGLPFDERIFDITVLKAKDWPDSWGWSYRATLEYLGMDTEGFPVHAPAVVLLSDDEVIAQRVVATVAGKKVPASVRHMVELFLRIQGRDGRTAVPREVLAASGYIDVIAAKRFDSTLPVYGIRIGTLQEAVYSEDSEVGTDEDGRRTVPDAARKRWERKRESLINSDAAWACDGWVWLAADASPDGGGR